MNFRILILLLLFGFSSSTTVNAQDDNKNVSITVSSSGETLNDAKQAALRSAIEQAYGSFISTKIEILNDQIVADQMASVSSGNIKSYDMLNESQLPNGTWGVTLKAIVSISKLMSFVEAKGITIDIKGGMFAHNIKQQVLNEQGEIKAVCEMVGLLIEQMQISFDYEIENREPKSLDAESKNWEIPLVVTATTNQNIDFCANYCIKTLAALSLSATEVESYKTLNKEVFPVKIKYNEKHPYIDPRETEYKSNASLFRDYEYQTFYLRKQLSINALKTLIDQWEFYVRGFSVQSGMDQSEGNGKIDNRFGRQEFRSRTDALHKFGSFEKPYNGGDYLRILFLTSGNFASTFSWNDERSLAQIEQMTGYSVKPSGVRLQFKHGGFVVYEEDGHGLVTTLIDLNNNSWEEAITACDELILNGYDDWRLPTENELNALYVNSTIGNFVRYYPSGNNWPKYWSSNFSESKRDEGTIRNPWIQNFSNGQGYFNSYNNVREMKFIEFHVRPVRTF